MTQSFPRDRPTTVRPPFDQQAKHLLAAAIGSGRVMAYPTETFYALGGNAMHDSLVERIFELKRRRADKAMLLLADLAQMPQLADKIPPAAQRLMMYFWPGPLTLVLHASPKLPRHLCDERGTVAVRSSPHPVVAALLDLGGAPLIGTSANITGEAPATSAADILPVFGSSAGFGSRDFSHVRSSPGVDLIVDDGESAGGLPSTILDTTVQPFRILRDGAIPAQTIRDVLQSGFPREAPHVPQM